MSRNECIRCVRAPGHALDHFFMNGGLNPSILGENGEDPWPKHAKTRVVGALRLSQGAGLPLPEGWRLRQGARRPLVRELAPGALDRTTRLLFRVWVLRGSHVGVRCDRFEVFFCCFHTLFYSNTIGFVETWIFQMV